MQVRLPVGRLVVHQEQKLFLWITSGNHGNHILLLINDRGDLSIIYANSGRCQMTLHEYLKDHKILHAYLRQLFTNCMRELDLQKSLVEDLLAGRPR
jgi:hypothetical protein